MRVDYTLAWRIVPLLLGCWVKVYESKGSGLPAFE